jgi:hypothetical protein
MFDAYCIDQAPYVGCTPAFGRDFGGRVTSKTWVGSVEVGRAACS